GADLVGLAAETHHQYAGEVRMPRIASDGALQRLVAFAAGAHAAAAAVGQRHHAIDVGELGQGRPAEPVGDVAGDGGGAVHAGQHADVVAGGDAPVLAHDAVEHRPLVLRHIVGRLRVGADPMVARERVHLHVVRM